MDRITIIMAYWAGVLLLAFGMDAAIGAPGTIPIVLGIGALITVLWGIIT